MLGALAEFGRATASFIRAIARLLDALLLLLVNVIPVLVFGGVAVGCAYFLIKSPFTSDPKEKIGWFDQVLGWAVVVWWSGIALESIGIIPTWPNTNDKIWVTAMWISLTLGIFRLIHTSRT